MAVTSGDGVEREQPDAVAGTHGLGRMDRSDSDRQRAQANHVGTKEAMDM